MSIDYYNDKLLGPADPPPFTLLNETGKAPLILFCDHAGRAFPRKLGNLGLSQSALDQHIAWDIGIANVAAILSRNLDAPCAMANYSRLVIDCNRRLDDPTSIAQESDRTFIPGNHGLDQKARDQRAAEIFRPYHIAVDKLIKAKLAGGVLPAILSLHSFTPVMNGFQRPWHFGILWNRDPRLPLPLMARLAQLPHVCVGDNEPYSGMTHGYGLKVHGIAHGIPHAELEIRQDLIGSPEGQQRWAAILAEVIAPLLADPALRKIEHH